MVAPHPLAQPLSATGFVEARIPAERLVVEKALAALNVRRMPFAVQGPHIVSQGQMARMTELTEHHRRSGLVVVQEHQAQQARLLAVEVARRASKAAARSRATRCWVEWLQVQTLSPDSQSCYLDLVALFGQASEQVHYYQPAE